MRFKTAMLGAALILASASAQAAPVEEFVTIDSHAGPWDQTLNPSFDYGVHDNSGPVVVSATFNFTAGSSFVISYLSGLTSPFGGTPYADGIGDTTYVANGNVGNSGTLFPSAYINSNQYPAYLNAVIGAFADSKGVIVGTPFLVGDIASVKAPAGASELMLGLNDDIFSDNTGSLEMIVSQSGTPEPATWALMIAGFGLVGAVMRRRGVTRVRTAYA